MRRAAGSCQFASPHGAECCAAAVSCRGGSLRGWSKIDSHTSGSPICTPCKQSRQADSLPLQAVRLRGKLHTESRAGARRRRPRHARVRRQHRRLLSKKLDDYKCAASRARCADAHLAEVELSLLLVLDAIELDERRVGPRVALAALVADDTPLAVQTRHVGDVDPYLLLMLGEKGRTQAASEAMPNPSRLGVRSRAPRAPAGATSGIAAAAAAARALKSRRAHNIRVDGPL